MYSAPDYGRGNVKKSGTRGTLKMVFVISESYPSIGAQVVSNNIPVSENLKM